MNKDETAIAVGLGLLVLGGGAALAASKKPGGIPNPKDDGDALVKRANQASARAWVSVFGQLPLDADLSAALARWAGIESSGNATAKSRLNERGLMQAGPTSIADGALDQADFDALIDPTTTKLRHAAIAERYVDWLAKRATTHLAGAPETLVDSVWYAKLYHQRPVDVRDVVGPLTKQLSTTDARTIARALAATWANEPKAMHRLRAANVVAWGTPTP